LKASSKEWGEMLALLELTGIICFGKWIEGSSMFLSHHLLDAVLAHKCEVPQDYC